MTPNQFKTFKREIERLKPLENEVPEIHVDNDGIIWVVEGDELFYGFAVELIAGTDVSLSSSEMQNRLTEGLRNHIRTLDQEVNVQVIYDRRPLTEEDLAVYEKEKDKGHESQIGKHQCEYLESEAKSERALHEDVVIVLRYPLNESLYRPYSIFKRIDRRRTEEALNSIQLRREAFLNQLRASGIEAYTLSKDRVQALLHQSLNPSQSDPISVRGLC